MNQAFWTEERTAGSLLVTSLLVLVLALIIMIASGAARGFSTMVAGSLAEKAPYAAAFRPQILLFAVGWVVQLLGLALLTRLLARRGEEQLAVLAFTLIIFAAVIGFLYSTFRMSVELWAAQEAARTGGVPDFYEPLRAWISDSFRVAYRAHFVAMAGFGLAILRTDLLSAGVGWAAIGWSALWVVGALVGAGAPGIPFIMPAVIGLALLWS